MCGTHWQWGSGVYATAAAELGPNMSGNFTTNEYSLIVLLLMTGASCIPLATSGHLYLFVSLC